jgi:hypothetical protein
LHYNRQTNSKGFGWKMNSRDNLWWIEVVGLGHPAQSPFPTLGGGGAMANLCHPMKVHNLKVN